MKQKVTTGKRKSVCKKSMHLKETRSCRYSLQTKIGEDSGGEHTSQRRPSTTIDTLNRRRIVTVGAMFSFARGGERACGEGDNAMCGVQQQQRGKVGR